MKKKEKNDCEFWQINLSIMNDGYTCSAWQVSYSSYMYTRKNFKHFFSDAGSRKFVLIANCECSKEQADRIIYMLIEGKFTKHDTSDFD